MRKRLLLFAGIAAVLSVQAADKYPINYPLDAKIDRPDPLQEQRYLSAVNLTSTNYGKEVISVPQKEDQLIYHDLTKYSFVATEGEEVKITASWMGTWMHGVVYIDRNNDGQFAWEGIENGIIPEGSDVMTFSSVGGFNSEGSEVGGNCGVNPPAFTLPADLVPGTYRMRFKVDWQDGDPGGNKGMLNNAGDLINTITKNGGSITDMTLTILPEEKSVTVSAPHGKVTLADGSNLADADVTVGKELPVKIIPDAGYQIASFKVEYGVKSPVLPDANLINAAPTRERGLLNVPAFLIQNNSYTIPAECTVGDLVVTAEFIEAGDEPSEGNYESKVSGSKAETAGITSFTIAADKTTTIDVATADRHFTHNASVIPVLKGTTLTPTVAYNGPATDVKFYIDVNQNGVFNNVSYELLSSGAPGQLPEFTLNPLTPCGVYRARIQAGDDCVVDFFLNIHNEKGNIILDVQNGRAYAAKKRALGDNVNYGGSLSVMVEPTLPGFEASELRLRSGHNLNGEQFIRGNKQWQEVVVGINETATLSNIEGDIRVIANFEAQDDCEWTYIWGDEFNSDKLDESKWSFHPRATSVWNMHHAVGDEATAMVNKFENGVYNSYAFKTPEEVAGDNPTEMLTGAIYSSGKFYMTGGYIECRMKTTLHTGNFPAFWMMPASQTLGWPNDGEIDIMETIDQERKSYHTVHDGWRYKNFGPVSQDSPTPGGNVTTIVNEWHVYALEWDQEALKWYVDGKEVFSYPNMHFSEGKYTQEITWPFYKGFYVILNQSVGNGAWARPHDPNFTYLTKFDYVRAYQKKNAFDYFSSADGRVTSGIEDIVVDGIGSDDLDPNAPVEYYNLQGVRVGAENLAPGIYVRRQGKNVTKVAIR